MRTRPATRLLSNRWRVAQCENREAAIAFAAHSFVHVAQEAVASRSSFVVALSGGSTPSAVYRTLSERPYSRQVEWSQVYLFWSDERPVPPDHADSNFRMAMESGFNRLPIPEENIFRMHAESDLEAHALAYEHLLKEVAGGVCDLVLLGMGTDGHTASLMPGTGALNVQDRLVVGNHIPQLKSWRMTFTFPCINAARHTHIYVLGHNKQHILREVLQGPADRFPIQGIGTSERPALWITDCPIEE
jgi:6-phosphogluconolactonase